MIYQKLKKQHQFKYIVTLLMHAGVQHCKHIMANM